MPKRAGPHASGVFKGLTEIYKKLSEVQRERRVRREARRARRNRQRDEPIDPNASSSSADSLGSKRDDELIYESFDEESEEEEGWEARQVARRVEISASAEKKKRVEEKRVLAQRLRERRKK